MESPPPKQTNVSGPAYSGCWDGTSRLFAPLFLCQSLAWPLPTHTLRSPNNRICHCRPEPGW